MQHITDSRVWVTPDTCRKPGTYILHRTDDETISLDCRVVVGLLDNGELIALFDDNTWQSVRLLDPEVRLAGPFTDGFFNTLDDILRGPPV